MTITSETVGPLREASFASPSSARHSSTADQLYTEGIALLDEGDIIGASRNLWLAVATAMETYSDAQGWKPEKRRFFHDIALFRANEMGLNIGDPAANTKIYNGFDAAQMLADNATQGGNVLYAEAIREDAKAVRNLLDTFSPVSNIRS